MKAIIFDFDGVIHNTLEIGHDVNNKLYGDVTLDEYKDIFNVNIYKSNKVDPAKYELFFEVAQPAYNKLEMRPDIKKELLKLKEKYLLFIISSGSEKIIRTYFENNSASNIFDEILGFETHTSKVEKFKILFKKYNFNKDDCMFVTDTLGDILEANKLGIETIAVDFGFHERERLEKGHPKKIVSHFKDIPLVIEEIAKSRN